jgi:hypothetical protein
MRRIFEEAEAMVSLARAVAAVFALGALHTEALAGDRSDAGIDADDARTQAILGTPGFGPADRGDHGHATRQPQRSSHLRTGRARASSAGGAKGLRPRTEGCERQA